VAEIDQHLTIEQLSASLDGQLSQSEQEYARQHLSTCEQCQQQQAELRQTVALLHALPRPTPSRSFMLPLDISLLEPVSTAQPDLPLPRSLHTQTKQPVRRAPWPPYLRTTMRVVSTLAAVVGIVFLLSSLLPARLGYPSASTASGSSASQAVSAPSAPMDATQVARNAQTLTQAPSAIQNQAATAQSSNANYAQAAQPTPAPPPVIEPSSNAPPVNPLEDFFATLFNLSMPEGRLIAGFLLFFLGIVGLLVFRRRKSIGRS
jgi:anti-sigma factor RsiW